MQTEVDSILKENQSRLDEINAPFNPVTGLGSVGERFELFIPDFPIKRQYLPIAMQKIPLVQQIKKAKTIKLFITDYLKQSAENEEDYNEAFAMVVEQFVRLRCRHDFAFWAATYVYIKSKGGGGDVLFRLTRPQRRYIAMLEECRLNNEPIRIVMLKARQWGGSTTTQMYMAWLQLCHRTGLNSLIIAHVASASTTIKAMFQKMLDAYPISMLHRMAEDYDENEKKLVSVGMTGNIHHVPQRGCNIQIGTAEKPDSCRSGDYSLVHLSEVGLWKKTEGKSPEDIVQAACSGVVLRPYTMIVMESTGKGAGSFFDVEYHAAKRGISQYQSIFVPWYEIEQDSLPFKSDKARAEFAQWLYLNRENSNRNSDREEPGRYLWFLWQQGATLEGINWYIQERKGKSSFAVMASENPTTDAEAFAYAGERVFDRLLVDRLKSGCKPPSVIGDVYADYDSGKNALTNLRFREDRQGQLWIWAHPEVDPDERVTDRYLCVVDVGGRSAKADWSVIVVFDRLFMAEGGKPVVVAQWYGHIDIDLLAWKSAQIAAYYDNALLVIESNTLETHDKDRNVDGDQSSFILNQIKEIYPNLYERSAPEESIVEGAPKRYGFHTNVSTKPMIISTLVKVIRESLYIERDERCLDEYTFYEKRANGSFGAIIGKHDDILMTRAIGLHICFYEMDVPKIIPVSQRSNYKSKKPISEATF